MWAIDAPSDPFREFDRPASARERIGIAESSIDIANRRAAPERNRSATGSSTAVQVLEAENAVVKADLIEAHLRLLGVQPAQR